MLKEVLEALRVQPGGRYVDCTVGQGGHASGILKRSCPGGQLLGIDIDPQAIKAAQSTLKWYDGSFLLVNENFKNLKEVCHSHNFYPVHGILFDLGMSSLQIADDSRGFSFQSDAPLDMRFSPTQELTADEIINKFSEEELARLIWDYGEDHMSRRIAKQVVQNRPIRTTSELAGVISRAVKVKREKRRIHPATKTFQALRIAVNREIENLMVALGQAIEMLGNGGRLVVISFHSLEDRPVKEFMKRESKDCICPPGAPVCTCGHTASLRLIGKGVFKPADEEIRMNPRSRSARMRVAERISQTNKNQEGVKISVNKSGHASN